MKNFSKAISATVLFCMIISLLSSCALIKTAQLKNKTDKEKAIYLSEQSELYYKDGIIQKTSVTGSITGNINGVEASGVITSTLDSAYAYPQTDDFAYLTSESASVSLTIEGITQTQAYTEHNGFVNGDSLIYSFIPQDDSKEFREATHLTSSCTPAEAWEYVTLRNTEIAFPTKGIENAFNSIEVEHDKKQKIWTITYSDFQIMNSPEIAQWLKDLTASLPAELNVTDMRGVFTIDAKSYALTEYQIKIKMSTEIGEAIDLAFDIDLHSSLSRPTERIKAPYSMQKYDSCGDLRYNYYALNALEALAASTDASFNMILIQQANHKKATSVNTTVSGDAIYHTENNVVHYGNADGKYRYSIETESNIGDFLFRYDGEKQTIYSGETPMRSVTQSEEEAKAMIRSLFSCFFFDEKDIIKMSVTKNEDGSSKVFLHFGITDYMNSLSQAAGYNNFESDDYYCRLQVYLNEDLELTSAEYMMRGEETIKVNNYGSQSVYVIATEATLTNVSQADESILTAE